MRIDRTKNAVRNTAYGWIGTMVAMLFPFLIRILITHILGVEYLGINSLFTSILVILNFSELGVGGAIVYSMYEPIAHDDEETICALLNLYKKLYRIIGIVVLSVGIAITPFLTYFIEGEIPSGYNLYILFIIYLLNSACSYCLFAYKTSLLFAFQRNEVVSKVNIVVSIVLYVLQALLLVFTKNYYCYIILMPLATIVTNLLNAHNAKKMFPKIYCHGMISLEMKNGIKKRVAGLMFDKMATASRNAFDSIIVSAILGLQAVAIYNNYYYVIGAITRFMTVILDSIAGAVGNSLVIESKEKNEQDLRILSFSFLSLAAGCYCVLLVLFQPVMQIWMGTENMFSETVMVAFAFYFLAQKTEFLVGRYYDAAGLWWHGRLKGIIEVVINIVLNIILGKLFGVIGIVLATLISILFVVLPLASYFVYNKVFKQKAKQYIIQQYLNLFQLGFIGWSSYRLSGMIIHGFTENIIMMFLKMLIAFGIFVILYTLVFSWQNQFKMSYIWIKNHIQYFIHRHKE